jgi:hypothetical protein
MAWPGHKLTANDANEEPMRRRLTVQEPAERLGNVVKARRTGARV